MGTMRTDVHHFIVNSKGILKQFVIEQVLYESNLISVFHRVQFKADMF